MKELLPSGKTGRRLLFLFALTAWFGTNRAVAQTAQLVGKAEHLLNTGRFNDALAAANAARKLLPLQYTGTDTAAAKVHLSLSKCWTAKFNSSLAAKHIDTALLRMGEQRTALFYRISMYEAAGKNDTAKIKNCIIWFEQNAPALKAEGTLLLGLYWLRKSDKRSVQTFKDCEKLLLAKTPVDSVSLAKCLQYRAFHLWWTNKEFDAALDLFRQAEKLFLATGGAKNDYLAPLYFNMGGCLDDMGNPRAAINLYKNAEAIFLEQQKNHPNLLSVYNNLGNSFGDLGESTLAVRYLEKAVELAPAASKGRYLNNLGDAWLGKNDYKQAKICFDSSLTLLLADTNASPKEVARPYHNLAVIQRKNGHYEKALELEMKSLPLRKKDPNGALDIARTYAGISETYLLKQQFGQAVTYADSALKLQQSKIPSGIYFEISDAFLLKAKCLAGKRHFTQAAMLIDSALYAGGLKPSGFDEVVGPPEVLQALAFKGELLKMRYTELGEPELLREAAAAFDDAARAMQYFRKSLLEGESKADLTDQFRSIISGGIEVALELFRLFPNETSHFEQAFSLSEQSKSLLLMEGMRSAGRVKFEGISEALTAREQQLQEAVTDAQIRVRELLQQASAAGNPQLENAKKELFQRRQDFENFLRSLQTPEYEHYYNFRYDVSTISVNTLQKDLLTPSSSLLSYFLHPDGKITTFVVNQDGVNAVTSPANTNLTSLVEQLRGGLLNYHIAPPAKRSEALYEKTVLQFVKAGQSLYDLLLKPVENDLKTGVVIVPDGVLGYIPFELLLTGAPQAVNNFATYPYWFKEKNHRVSYAYSATLLREMVGKTHPTQPSSAIFAMAPFDPKTGGGSSSGAFPDLIYSGDEVRTIAGLWNGQSVTGKEATRARFIKEAPKSAIIHLSTHGVLDNTAEFSYLAFAPAPGQSAPEPLFINDLYNLQLHADMVTLSACETAVGALQKGEGIISVARAFTYAGAKSIFTSLWQVNDLATKELMELFYGSLKSGKSKDDALDSAKRTYVENHPGAQSHPFFWGGFIGIGDMRIRG